MFHASIRGNRLEGYITEEKTAPNRFITSSNYAGTASGSMQQIKNPNYVTWRSEDQILPRRLLSSVSEGILSLLLPCNTFFDVWRNLEKKFGVQSEAGFFNLDMRCMF